MTDVHRHQSRLCDVKVKAVYRGRSQPLRTVLGAEGCCPAG